MTNFCRGPGATTGVCGGQSSTVIGFYVSNSVFPSQYIPLVLHTHSSVTDTVLSYLLTPSLQNTF